MQELQRRWIVPAFERLPDLRVETLALFTPGDFERAARPAQRY
jgi:hypothetical protein